MGDLIQLQEKGVKKYMVTTVKGVEGLSEITETKVYKVNYATGFKDYSEYQPLEISVVNGRAIISGAFTNTAKIAAGAEVVIGTAPKGCLPIKLVTSPKLQGTGSSDYILQINVQGSVVMSRYRYGTTDNPVEANSFLSVNMSYDAVVESEE